MTTGKELVYTDLKAAEPKPAWLGKYDTIVIAAAGAAVTATSVPSPRPKMAAAPPVLPVYWKDRKSVV